MRKCFLFVLLLALITVPSEFSTSKAEKNIQQSGSLTGVVVGRERLNGDYSLGVSFNYERKKDKPIDEVRIKLPFKYKSKIGFKDVNWESSVKGSTVKIKDDKKDERTDDEKAEEEFALSSINFRLDFAEIDKAKITGKLKAPIKFSTYSDGEKVDEEESMVVFMPKLKVFYNGDVVFLPGKIPMGGKFKVTVNDDLEQLVQEKVLNRRFGSVDRIYRERMKELWKVTKPKGKTDYYQSRPKEFKDKEQSFDATTKLGFDSSFQGSDQIRIIQLNQLSDDVKTGDKLKVKYTDRFGEEIYNGETEEVDIVDKAPKCKFQINKCAKYGIAGQMFCGCGCFEANYDVFALQGFKLDGKPIYPQASSTTAVSFYLKPDLTPGEHTITYTNKEKEVSSVKFTVVKVNGAIDQKKLWTGQSTSMRLRILGTNDILPLEITNRTPTIIRLAGGRYQKVKSSGGATNLITKGVTGIKRGNFNINYKLNLPYCPCDDLSEDF